MKLHTVAHPARLSLIFGIAPLGFLIEACGGDTSDLQGSVLDIKITGRKQKVNFIAGSKEDVKYIVEELNTEGNIISFEKNLRQHEWIEGILRQTVKDRPNEYFSKSMTKN